MAGKHIAPYASGALEGFAWTPRENAAFAEGRTAALKNKSVASNPHNWDGSPADLAWQRGFGALYHYETPGNLLDLPSRSDTYEVFLDFDAPTDGDGSAASPWNQVGSINWTNIGNATETRRVLWVRGRGSAALAVNFTGTAARPLEIIFVGESGITLASGGQCVSAVSDDYTYIIGGTFTNTGTTTFGVKQEASTGGKIRSIRATGFTNAANDSGVRIDDCDGSEAWGNYCYGNSRGIVAVVNSVTTAGDYIVQGNYCFNNTEYGIQSGGANEFRNTDPVTVQYNECVQNGTGIESETGLNVTIRGNKISDCDDNTGGDDRTGHGIRVVTEEASGQDCQNYIVEDNIIDDVELHGIVFYAANSNGITDTTIRRNKISNFVDCGIATESSATGTFDGFDVLRNRIVSSYTGTANHYGVNLDPSSTIDNCIVASNYIELTGDNTSGNERGIRLQQAPTDGICDHNTVLGWYYGIHVYGGGTNWTFTNNDLDGRVRAIFDQNNSMQTTVLDANVYRREDGSTSTAVVRLGNPQTDYFPLTGGTLISTIDSDAVVGAPTYVGERGSIDSNLTPLTTGSAQYAQGSTGSSITTDINGAAFDASTPNIGAWSGVGA